MNIHPELPPDELHRLREVDDVLLNLLNPTLILPLSQSM